MFGLGLATKVYLALGATDMRKGFEGLYGLVRERLLCEPTSGHLFLFSNARRNRLKILYWDGYATLAIMGRCDGSGATFKGTGKGRLCIAIPIISRPLAQKLESRVAAGI